MISMLFCVGWRRLLNIDEFGIGPYEKKLKIKKKT